MGRCSFPTAKGGDGMNGDGISVAANIADFASPSRLLASSDFRDALADASPGAETRLAPAGVLTDPGLRSHELFGPDVQGPRRRRQRYAAFAVAVVVAGIAAGVAYRVSLEGSERFFGGLQAKGAGYLSAGLSRLRFWEVPPSQIAPPLRGKAARDKGRG